MKAILSSSLSRISASKPNSKTYFNLSQPRLLTKYTDSQLRARAVGKAGMDEDRNYREWSQDRLVQKVIQLEDRLREKTASCKEDVVKKRKKARSERQFDPSSYSTQLVALKVAYLGKGYNGFEFHANNPTPLPTIEEELWKALNKSRLILPSDTNPLEPGKVKWEGCEYSKCGRTDKGVSAFGQVIGIRVRSNRPLKKGKANGAENLNNAGDTTNTKPTRPKDDALHPPCPTLPPLGDMTREKDQMNRNVIDGDEAPPFDPVMDEISYPTILNRLLPPDIRILAWCPVSPNFSARFSCKERQYKYFFTQPSFPPIPQHLETKSGASSEKATHDGWLDIAAMREAAKKFIGLHDFRNFCKVDGSKQISNFERRIFYADIVEEDSMATLEFLSHTSFLPEDSIIQDTSGQISRNTKVYSFTLHGSAFLWHQVRHMVAILFLVGQGLENPSVVSELLDAERNPRRPIYEMADDTPLVLWDCVFPHKDDLGRSDALPWLYVGDEPGRGDNKYGSQALIEILWRIWRERKMDETLAATLINVVARQGKDVLSLTSTPKRGAKSQRVFDGGNAPRLQGTYVPVMNKPMLETTEAINEKYAIRKGFEGSEDLKEQGFRRLNKHMGMMDSGDS